LSFDRLKMAGIDEPLARAHAEALRDALSEAVATKADLNDAVAALKADMTDLKRHVDEEVKRVERKIDQLENKMDNRFEIVSRELIIKGAGGLALVSSLMIGLKLFH